MRLPRTVTGRRAGAVGACAAIGNPQPQKIRPARELACSTKSQPVVMALPFRVSFAQLCPMVQAAAPYYHREKLAGGHMRVRLIVSATVGTLLLAGTASAAEIKVFIS